MLVSLACAECFIHTVWDGAKRILLQYIMRNVTMQRNERKKTYRSLLHDDVRSREENGQRGHDGEHCENEEAYAIDDHGGELPIGDQIVLVLLLF